MKTEVELEAVYPHPPERVWKAISKAGALSRWLMPTDFEPMIGFRFRFEKPSGAKVKGKVIEAEEGALLAYTWTDEDDGQESVVVWTLEPKDGGTKVTVRHRAVEQPEVTCLAVDYYFNWLYALRHGLPGMLRLLQARQGRVPPPPFVVVQEVGL